MFLTGTGVPIAVSRLTDSQTTQQASGRKQIPFFLYSASG